MKKQKIGLINKIVTILLISCIGFSGCSMQMSADERAGLFAGEDVPDIKSELVIKNPEGNQFARLIVEYYPYDLKKLGVASFKLSPEEIEQNKMDDNNFYTFFPEKLGDPGLITGLNVTDGNSHFSFNSIADEDIYDRMISWEADGNPYADSNIKKQFPKEEISQLTKKEAEDICNAYVNEIGFPYSSVIGYALDVDSLNHVQNVIKKDKRFNMEMPAPGYERDEKGQLVGELQPWREDQEAYVFYYKQEYKGVAIESVSYESLLTIYCNRKDGIFYAKSQIPVLSDTVKQEEMVTILPGEEILKLSQSVLKQLHLSVENVTDVSLVYTCPNLKRDLANHMVVLDPAWKVAYSYSIGEQEYSDYLLMDGTTGEPLDNSIVPLD